jgi:hypothetical protein
MLWYPHHQAPSGLPYTRYARLLIEGCHGPPHTHHARSPSSSPQRQWMFPLHLPLDIKVAGEGAMKYTNLRIESYNVFNVPIPVSVVGIIHYTVVQSRTTGINEIQGTST